MVTEPEADDKASEPAAHAGVRTLGDGGVGSGLSRRNGAVVVGGARGTYVQ